MRGTTTRALPILMFAALSACGGGGGGSGDSASGGGGGAPPTVGRVALLFVSGHTDFDGQPSYSYLQQSSDAGPEIVTDLLTSGFDVTTGYYVDDADAVGAYDGFLGLVDDMHTLRDTYVPQGYRVIVIAHSHGGVWAHGAIRAVPDLPIFAIVDLDCNSYGWNTVGHTAQNATLGGDPRDAYNIGATVSYAAYASAPNETNGIYDLEDVVFPNVANSLDVRSGDEPIRFFGWFDEHWNCRVNGTTTGLYGYVSYTTHEEVHAGGGTTLAVVRQWLHARLGA